MSPSTGWLGRGEIEGEPDAFLAATGTVFARFDRQDSGNVSYGVEVAGRRHFVKTAGRPDDPRPFLGHADRVALLRNAVRVAEVAHATRPRLQGVLESSHGPLLVYEWLEGELLGGSREWRARPDSAHQRFRELPAQEICRCLDLVFDLHARLAAAGWVTLDFYDSCLLYAFDSRRLGVIDLDHYHQGPFENAMGRLFGSSRFMAPEEFEHGALVDERTSVFAMGRVAAVLLSDGTLEPARFRGSEALRRVALQACRRERTQRPESMAAFLSAWQAARGNPPAALPDASGGR